MVTKKAQLVFKTLCASCLLMMLVLVMVDALAEPLETKIVAAHGGLNVRREPNINSQIVYTLEETTVVVILEWKDGWARVANNNYPYMAIGWACGDYLK